MSGRSSPFSDVFSGVGEHFCFKEGALDFDLSSEDGDISEPGFTPPHIQNDAAYQLRDQLFRGKTVTSHVLPRFDSPKEISCQTKGSMIEEEEEEDASVKKGLPQGEVYLRGHASKDSPMSYSLQLLHQKRQIHTQQPQQQSRVQPYHQQMSLSRRGSLNAARSIQMAAYSSRILPTPSSFAMTDTSFKFTDAFWDHLEKFRSNSKSSKGQLHAERLARGCQIPFSFRPRADENVLS